MNATEPTPESPDPGQCLTDDPEIAALLTFTPVPRRIARGIGWSAENQRAFIVGLAETGNHRVAAQRLGLTASGVYQLRKDAGAEEFSRAWDEALALHKRRNPPAAIVGSDWPTPSPPPSAPSSPEPEEPDEDARWAELCDGILTKYLLKLEAEREARLAGRIVEADYYVRQLTWLEVALDLGGLGERVVAMLMGLKRGERHAGQIAATPVSLLLDQLRRAYWEEEGGPERPPPPALGPHADADASPGEPLECQWTGHGEADREARQRKEAIQAEAQLLWEAKAKADAAAWAARLGSSPGFPGEGDRPQDGGGAPSDNEESHP